MNGQTIGFCSKTQKVINTRKFYNFFLNDSGGDRDKTFVQTRKEKGKNCYSAMLALLVGSLMAFRGTCIITRFHWLNTYAIFTFNQSEVRSKPIATCSHSFTRAFRGLHASASRSHWFIGFSITYEIGQNNY